MAKRIVFIHGRHFKHPKDIIERNWIAALRYGIARDHGENKAIAFDIMPKTFAYYGDLSNEFLCKSGKTYNEQEDIADRENCLDRLKGYQENEFLGNGGRENSD